MLIGQMRNRVTFSAATAVTDSLGGQSTTWVPLVTVWGEFRALTGRESLQAGALQASMTHRVTIRYRADVSVKMRARREPNGPTCDITAVRDATGRRQYLELDLVEVP